MADLLRALNAKMVRRHPHVFAGAAVGDAREALAQWERIKQGEGPAEAPGRSAVDGLARALPALLRAQRLQVKAGRVGFDWPDWRGAWAKSREEQDELQAALESGDRERIREELGDLLFAVVNVARLLEMDAEDTLRQATEKFTRRFRDMEAQMRAAGGSVAQASLEDMDRAWTAAKAREAARPEATDRS